MLEKAGDSFSLAKCYDLAVEEYEKAGAFAKCLSACTDGKFFEFGFELLGRCREWGGAKLEFLRKGAHYYFLMKDFKNMMKFVHSFNEKDDMRSFLSKRRCFDQLIFLEKEWGNFEEAAKVARRKPDPVLEADLLQMGGLNRESSLVILWHVFSNSLIFQNVKELFTQDELLQMAISNARIDSNVFYQFVCKEAEILSHEKTTEEELLEKGLEFIYCYKENDLAMSLERVKTTHEIKKIETNVLDLICFFLKSTNRLNKLLLLHEVYGEFVEAAKIGNEEHSIESALRSLWYIFFGSLWACGRRAWPLKDFKHKTKLLDDAYAYATDHLDSEDSALVHREIQVLSGEDISLSDMWTHLKETPQETSLRIHFLISRRILDVHLSSHCKVYASVDTQVEDETLNHLDDRLLKNMVCVEGLIYFWNYWKDIICALINWSHTCGQGCKASNIYEDFILNYFGVRKYDEYKPGRYVVLDAEAQWVKQTRPFIIRKGYLHIILAHQFSSAVSRYWCSELLFVARNVFGKFQSLHDYSTDENLSMHQQTKILACLFEAVRSLQKCKFLNGRKHDNLTLDKYSEWSVDQFLRNVSHINWKHAQSKEMICVRRNETFLNMVKEATDLNSKSLEGLSCEQLGRIAVVLLGYKLIGFNADTKRKLGCSSMNWRNLFKKLMNRDRSISRNEDLAISLHNILEETYSAGWQEGNDCMSPACFLYVMDRLLILSFCFRGYVFTTRSSCVEWLSYGECGMGSNGGSATSLDTMKNIHHSLASMVIKMLNSPYELMEWLRRSNESESLYPILILRLTVLLSLICANSELHYDHLYDQLGRGCIISSLPSEFSVTLINGMKEDRLLEAVAVACKMIDNPLVIVSAKEDFPKVPCAKFLNIKKPEVDEESLIEMLYHDLEAQESAAPLLSN
ncbi:putative TPR and ankyrin repeat-containing protein [Helianthus annuus]|nr:putative TPR and ankyrin repeat-containing protein [Helianthus annuus]KAJ0636249.1 putative TPR and ankyrin repeat-containing protein [Helianthus annuus]